MVTMFVQNDMKKPEHKTRSESRDIDENKIVQWLDENVQHCPPASGQMTSNAFLWRHREHGW